MMKNIISVVLIMLLQIPVFAQVTGLWEVIEVKFADESHQPVAHWYQLNSDKSVYSGHGWLQSTAGTYVATPDNSVLIIMDQYGKTDEQGAYRVSLAGNKMIWERVEQGQPVIRTLAKVDKKPAAPWDHILGTWKIVESAVHPQNSQMKIEMRWDREYLADKGLFDNNTNGVWHIDRRGSKLSLINLAEKTTPLRFDISFFKDYRMIWVDEENKTRLVFDRSLE
jgi:hypothetical protein